MWRTNTLRFDAALVSQLIAVGEVCFGRFSEYQPRARRVLKAVLGTALFVTVSAFAGRAWMFAALGVALAALGAVHGWWLPRHGVSGWTAEPRDRYYALLGLGPDGRRR